MTKPKLGFIGIGDMGGPMAGRLLDAGFPLVIYDVRDGATAPLGTRTIMVVDPGTLGPGFTGAAAACLACFTVTAP